MEGTVWYFPSQALPSEQLSRSPRSSSTSQALEQDCNSLQWSCILLSLSSLVSKDKLDLPW